MKEGTLAHIALRAGVAFAFLYPPINALFDPYAWIGYFPPFVKGFIPDLTLLHIFGAVEVILALWILSGWRIFWPSLTAGGMLLGIVVFNMPNFQVLFRDISIAAMSLALAVISYQNHGIGISGRTGTEV
ncbi:hypothetical protein C4556_02875 [Candidatus Parcubacteria bacterium]|nr:MAG: hypothetical protein C4556_02875 [Candidatus Parcubacteria bacterium]